MLTINLISPTEKVDKSIYGGKAYWLSWLISEGYNVPECFFVPAVEEEEISDLIRFLKSDDDFNRKLKSFKIEQDIFEVAIRSSAINEDSIKKSYAGYFKSFVENVSFIGVLENIEKVVKSISIDGSSEKQKMGIIIQKKIKSKYSGVIFSSNPITLSKQELVVSMTEGMGEKLVSGKVAGEDVVVAYENNEFKLSNYKTQIDEHYILELCEIAKRIELSLNVPVDIEWCLDVENEHLYILQCRPITTIFPNSVGVVPINLANEENIPDQVRFNDKVRIRLLAQSNGIDISKAYLVVSNNTTHIDDENLSKIQPEDRCKGYSVVLIFPKTISGNIIRHFAENEFDRQNSAFRTCQRYDVRSYQDFGSLKGILQSIQAKCCEASWVCIAIIQEIFEPFLTGIAKKIEDGFLIEVAKGHFVPKGVVPTSQYVLNNKKEVVFKNEIIQDFAYSILQGKVSKEDLNELISVENKTLRIIVDKLMPILSAGVQAVEFGLLKNETTNQDEPYLIDLVDDNSATELSTKLISEGVISMGIKRGKATILDTNTLGQNSLELHFHDHFENKGLIDENIIFITETPDIALLEVLRHYNNDKIGFIFKEGSALSHFSIILREKKIPAIVIDHGINFTEMEEIKIDATTPNLKGAERIGRQSGCVTSYINPDTDGICSGIAYANYIKHKGKNYLPVYFGELDKETEFVLKKLEVSSPQKVSTVNEYDEIVIVDTHHVAQLSKEIPLDKVVEIIDHHPDGNPESFPNAKIQNDKIGAACTIIAERMKKENIIPDAKISGLISLAIISNTLNFTAPSTSQRDRDALEWLSGFCEITNELIREMFEARSNVSSVPSRELIKGNLKEFNWGDYKVGISQVEMTDINVIVERPDFLNSLLNVKQSLRLNYIFFTGVNILRRSSTIFCPNQETLNIINKGMGFDSSKTTFEVDRILLRKTDFIPKLKHFFEVDIHRIS